jgi:hypothetical protein
MAGSGDLDRRRRRGYQPAAAIAARRQHTLPSASPRRHPLARRSVEKRRWSSIRRVSATEKNPKQITRLGFFQCCCLRLGSWTGRLGCRGMGEPPCRPTKRRCMAGREHKQFTILRIRCDTMTPANDFARLFHSGRPALAHSRFSFGQCSRSGRPLRNLTPHRIVLVAANGRNAAGHLPRFPPTRRLAEKVRTATLEGAKPHVQNYCQRGSTVARNRGGACDCANSAPNRRAHGAARDTTQNDPGR